MLLTIPSPFFLGLMAGCMPVPWLVAYQVRPLALAVRQPTSAVVWVFVVVALVNVVPSFFVQRYMARRLTATLWRRLPQQGPLMVLLVSLALLLLSALPVYWVSDIQGDVHRYGLLGLWM
jgi:hypothetical protein